MYTYPTPADNLPAFIGLVSEFWNRIYGGADLVFDYLRGCMVQQQQIENDLVELQNSVSRHLCPVFHTEVWFEHEIFESRGTPGASGVISYFWPGDVRDVFHAVNGILFPTAMLTEGVDFTIDPNNVKITFLSNPFLNPNLQPEPVIEDGSGTVTDRKIRLWFVRAQLDRRYIFEQFGYVVGPELRSSANYKGLVVALLDGISGATAYHDVARAVGAVVDIPVVRNPEETVEVIASDAEGLFIATDLEVYRFVAGATPTVSVGDVVRQSDTLTDAFVIYEPYRGETPDLVSITLDEGLLDPTILGPLTFANTSTPLLVIPNVSGFTKVTWALGGDPGDVTDFFDLLHTKGIDAGKTLAMCLDQRPQPQITQPMAGNLPATINPMEFLFENALRSSFVVRLKPAEFGPQNLGTEVLGSLRQIVPPHTAMIVVNI